MKLPLAILLTTLYGLSIRLVFGFLDGLLSIMSITFLFLLPIAIGYFTIVLLPYKESHTATGAFFKPWLTCLVLLVITIAFSIEGTICWLMIFPIFAVFAGIGGVIAYNRKKKRHLADIEMDIDKEDWDKPGALQISFLVFLPLFVGFLEGNRILSRKEMTITKEVVIHASPTAIWQQLVAHHTVQPKLQRNSFSSLMGFPNHLRTSLDTLAIGGKRVATYEKGLTFEETITAYIPAQLLVLNINADPSKIPPTTLDEHIVIGGKHVDILQDTYQLKQLPNGDCQLSLSSKFFINTPFNWYAGIWARFLMSDILKGELTFIKNEVAKQ